MVWNSPPDPPPNKLGGMADRDFVPEKHLLNECAPTLEVFPCVPAPHLFPPRQDADSWHGTYEGVFLKSIFPLLTMR
jgi:hypothetical protein